ncbi:putative Ig domain-containing protein, partial [Vibrio penaeicida]|uniref:putative Ig domain-containing protein n=1 Tax=Vibrio penaeicida TaxID=104609 RepID=UPI002733CD71
TLTVTNVNDVPVISGMPATTVNEDEAYRFTPTMTDADNGDSHTFSIVNKPVWAMFDTATGTLSGTPTNDHVGSTANIVIAVEDGAKAKASLPAFTLTVTNVNDVPVISGMPATTVNEDEAYRFTPTMTDADSGDSHTFSIENQPAWSTFNTATGELSGTPTNDHVGHTENIVISVEDAAKATASMAAFSLTVTNVNDAPVISGTPATTVIENAEYRFVPTASDVDTNDTLTFNIGNKPDWATFDSVTGTLSGAPSQANVGTYADIQLGVSDGNATVLLPVFSITVQGDLDGDGIADIRDVDIDGDGMSNAFEEQYGLDPRSSADAHTDLDGDGMSNLDEFLAETDPTQDSVAPVFLADNQHIELNASGVFTKVEVGVVSAHDTKDGPVAVSPQPEYKYLKPGNHSFTYTATDAAGNQVELNQVVAIHPLIAFEQSQRVEEGAEISVAIHLNGESPVYPLVVPFEVTSDSTAQWGSDHTLESGHVVFSEGETEQVIRFLSVQDNVSEGDERLHLVIPNIDGTLNVAKLTQHVVTISEHNLAPELEVQITQNQERRTLLSHASGMVSVAAVVSDGNSKDTHTFEWHLPDELNQRSASGSVVTFDPTLLPLGHHEIIVVVTDSGTPALSVSSKHNVVIKTSLAALSAGIDTDGDGMDDVSESYADNDADGVPDYLDPESFNSNVIAHEARHHHTHVLQSSAGTTLTLGSRSSNTAHFGVLLKEQDQTFEKDFASNVGGVFDFEIRELSEHGQSASVVIPQTHPIPEEAIYRKYSVDKGWFDFVEDQHNVLSSVQGEKGYCPAPESGAYEENGQPRALTAGHWCIKMTIQDGGPNDMDGEANGTIVDPGGVASKTYTDFNVKTGSGAAVNVLLFIFLCLGAMLRTGMARRRS